MSKEQPPLREVIPYKSGKRPSTFRRLNIDFAGTALEEALNEQQSRKIEELNVNAPDKESSEATSHHQSPPVTTTPHSSYPNNIENLVFSDFSDENTHLQSSSILKAVPSSEDSPPVTTTPQQGNQINKSAIAPARDFNRRANSLDRDAMPSGTFPGSTKKVYDALYLRTRGAVVPVKSVRASRRDLLTWTGIRNLKTIDNHIRYLMATGLIVRNWELGSNEGSSYEIRLPEEVQHHSPPVSTSGGDSLPLTTTTQNMGSGYTQKSGSGGEGQLIDNINTSVNHKTSYKTNDDDETHTLGEFAEILREAACWVVGGNLNYSEQERERWNELGKLLADELKEAAQRADSISSVPAFFTAHLRRKLMRKPVPAVETKKPVESPGSGAQALNKNSGQVKAEKNGRASAHESDAAGKSKFSLEECRRYADHLHTTGQGIINPGGFALTIYRSGISDELIEKFLHPETATHFDASACETCKGTGFFYPHGAEQGVAKCRHEELRKVGARRLKPEEITEQAEIIAELLESGYTLEQAETQFGASLDDNDWGQIRTRLERKRAP